MRLMKPEAIYDANDELSQRLGRFQVRASLGKTEVGKIHRDHRTEFAEDVPSGKKSQDAFGQRAQQKNRVAVMLVICCVADLQPVNGLILKRAQTTFKFQIHKNFPFRRDFLLIYFERSGVTAQRSHLHFHEWIKRKRI